MKIIKKTLFIFCFATALAFLYSAEMELTLERAQELATNQNSDIKKQEIELASAQRADKNAWNSLIPSLSLNGGISNSHTISDGKTFFPKDSSSWSWSGSAGISIGLNTAIPIKAKITSLTYSSAKTAYSKLVSNTRLQATTSFYNLLSQQKNIAILEESLNLAKKQYDQVNANYKNGLASELELLKARYSYQSIQPRITQAQTSYQNSLSSFLQLLGLDAGTQIKFKDNTSIKKLNLPPADKLADEFVENRFDVIQAREALIRAQLSESLSKHSAYSPSINISESLRSGSEIKKDAKTPGLNGSFSVSVSIPLNGYIPGSNDNLSIKNSKDSVSTAAISLENVIKNARQDINNKTAELVRLYESLATNRLNSTIAEKAYELSVQSYNAGLLSQTELATQRQELITAKQTLSEAESNYLVSIYNLAAALNIPVNDLVSKYGAKNEE
ncbi:MAG: TolC family protein [Spirochaetaceae bacterium]|nr:TolC family protein [Spirochaetaceae bacterium]